MSSTISGGISFSGLGSGIDTDSIIESLKSAQEIQKNRYELSQAEYEYRISALEEVVTKMREAMDVLSKFNTTSKMFNLSIESSDSAVASATVKSTDNIPQGSYTLDIQQTATTSMYCSKTIFDAKDAVINDTGTAHTFTYTYKGVTREINVADGTNLEQLVSRINNDAQNPGVRATLIKNGSGYMFQIQGTDTGKDADLSISSTLPSLDSSYTLFTGSDVVLSETGGTFKYYYGGKERSFTVDAGMTAQEFVEKFNEDSKQPLKATLKLDGSDYTIEFSNRSSGTAVSNLQISTDIEALGGKKFSGTGDIVNNTGTDQTFTYSYLGKNYSVTLGSGATMQDLLDAVNSNPDHVGLTASFDSASGSVQFSYKDAVVNSAGTGDDKNLNIDFEVDGKKHEIAIDDGMSLQDYVQQFNEYSSSNSLGITAKIEYDSTGQNATIKYVDENGDPSSVAINCPNSGVLAGTESIAVNDVVSSGCISADVEGFGKKAVISGADSIINNSGGNQTFSFSFGDPAQSFSLSVADGTTLQEFAEQFNADSAIKSAGLKAEVMATASGYKLVYKDSSGKEVQLENINAGSMGSIGARGDNWYKQDAQDAVFTVNGWDQVFTSSTNTLTEVIEGMEITIKSTGKTVLNTVQDTSKIKENIQEVVDALNLVKGTILSLSEVDSEKETDEYEEGELTSQLTWQIGSALTGNYGVQLVLSDYNNVISGMSTGFSKKQAVDDVFGDLFTTLADIGITTNTNAGDEDFGLLVIDETELDEALAEDAAAVVELLSSTMKGTTTSADFTVASTGVTSKAGSYEVTYDVDANGQATNVYINGVAAKTDSNFPGRWTVADPNNDAAGVAIQFATGGMAQGSYSSTINIRQGKINELYDFFEQEVASSTVEGVEQGHIPTIIASYQESIDQLQEKIDSETDRIALWEQREKLKYARLEQTLTEYNQKMSQISSYTVSS